MPLLKDKVAVITGASSGIGRAIALMFAEEARWPVSSPDRPYSPMAAMLP